MRDVLASPLFDAALRGAIILLVALVLTVLLHRRSAALRHAIWAGAIAAQVLLLGLAVWGPRWRVVAPDAVSALVPARADERPAAPALADRAPTETGLPASAGAATYVPPTADRTTAPRDTVAPATSPAPASTPARTRPSATRVLFVVWALGAAAVLLRLAVGTMLVARLARRGQRIDDGGWLSLAQRLANTLRIERPLILMRGDRLGVPVTWGVVYPVVLLPDDADEWPEERRRYVLVHEMAHVKRLDALTQLVGQLALALFWFDPLVWIAVRRMQLEREHACDDYVLRHGTQPSRYAADLLEMVQSLGTPAHRAAQPAFAALAMARRSEFEGRMLSILDPVLDRHPLHRGRTLMSALASLLVIVPLAALQPYRQAPQPTHTASASASSESSASASRSATSDSSDSVRSDQRLSQRLESRDSSQQVLDARVGSIDTARARIATSSSPSSSSASGSNSASGSSSSSGSTSSTSTTTKTRDDDSCDGFRYGNSSQTGLHMHADDDDGRSTVRYLEFDQSRCRQAAINGKIVTTLDENRIVSLTPAPMARAYFRERTGSTDRELTFAYASNDARTLVPLYRVNGVERPFDDEGQRWFAELLPRVLAEAAINVEPRVARWRAREGVGGTLRHIDELRSSGAKRAHYGVLLDNKLSQPELEQLVRQAGRDIPSSGDLRAVLSKAGQQTRQSRLQGVVLDSAIGAVASSGDRTAVLMVFGQSDDRDQLLAVMRIAQTIPSSGDKTRLLVELAPRYLGRTDAALRQAFFATAVTIPSSGDLSRVLMTAVPFAAKSNDIALATIESAGEIASSSDRAGVLVALAGAGAVRTPAVRDAYLRVTKDIASSTDARHALEAIARN
ncbi:MAG TPA: M56 family metallopeptidase [Gemmatimonadaceae bacterium]|nr:M56 family metallopeptidase [Gemmatimonadaceae bacterium]